MTLGFDEPVFITAAGGEPARSQHQVGLASPIWLDQLGAASEVGHRHHLVRPARLDDKIGKGVGAQLSD
jgi:hypothetical protein